MNARIPALCSTALWLAALCLAALWASVAAGQVYRPEVPIAQVAHQGDPVPGVFGATFTGFAPPQIDAAGNVLLRASMAGPGIDDTNDVAIWFGQPGAIQMVARDGDRAPDMPQGVIYADVAFWAVVSETGWIAFTAYVSGPGITEGVNDAVIFCGPPGDFQKALQTSDPAPGFWPGVEVFASDSELLGAGLTDNGTLFIGGGAIGPDLPADGTRAYWMGSRDNLVLMAWEGMPVVGCPECDPDVTLDWEDRASMNDAGQMAFCGGMSGPGIYPINDTGRWLGSPGDWEMIHREGQPAPEFGAGVTLRSATGALYALNRHGDKVNGIRLQGPGITSDNDWVLVAGQPEPMDVVIREGDGVPEAGEDVYVKFVGGSFINDLHHILYCLYLDGPSIDESNEHAIYYGPYNDPRMILRDGDAAPYFPSGTILDCVAWVEGYVAMNDVGDFAAMTQIQTTPPGSEPETVVWMWHGLTRQYVPVLEVGTDLFGRTVTTDMFGSLGDYWTLSGGGDGLPQSFNDARQLAVELDFTEGTRGVYRIGPPLLGDTDGDGVVTVAEFATFAECMTEPGGDYAHGCAALDFDLDSDIDLADFRVLQALLGETR